MAGKGEALKKQKKEHPEREHVDTVNTKRTEYDNALKELHEAHKAYCEMLNDDQDKEEGKEEADGYLISIQLKSKGFIAELEQLLEQSKVNVEPGDSAIQVGSNVNITSSAKVQAAARRAALSVKAAILKDGEELELAELRLHQKKKAMEVQRELPGAEAEEKVNANAEEGINTQPVVIKPKVDWNPNTSA
ncbi:hypothetical protein HOLleu_13708 [Holothuria leucospilota]|uniref:Uncharacterized protein n=1 Tax=Holothuria leucospilota TaxID=206669 RepID=A0A9Q1HBX9_HOLLE|nr:hypothetical protein HOLleu_13708 [Holothuria leucospilota]